MFWKSLKFDPRGPSCVSTGRNGDYTTTGLSVTAVTNRPVVIFQGITSRGVAARGDITVPLSLLPELVETLQRAFKETAPSFPELQVASADDYDGYGQENQHHYYDWSDWKEAVENDETRLGYDAWVNHLLTQKQDELEELRKNDPDDLDGINFLRGILEPDFDEDADEEN